MGLVFVLFVILFKPSLFICGGNFELKIVFGLNLCMINIAELLTHVKLNHPALMCGRECFPLKFERKITFISLSEKGIVLFGMTNDSQIFLSPNQQLFVVSSS